jgi:hypothetical protein
MTCQASLIYTRADTNSNYIDDITDRKRGEVNPITNGFQDHVLYSLYEKSFWHKMLNECLTAGQ